MCDHRKFTSGKTHQQLIVKYWTAAHTFDKHVEGLGKLAPVGMNAGFVIATVGTGFLEGVVNERLVVERAGEVCHRRIDKDVAVGYGRGERHALETAATRQCHIGLSAGKGSVSQVDDGIVECQSLALVDCECPGQFYRILCEAAEHGLVNLFGLGVEGVFDIVPHLLFEPMCSSRLEGYFKQIGSHSRYTSYCAVDPAMVRIIFDKHHLRTLFEREVEVGGQRVFGKITLDDAVKFKRRFADGVEMGLIDMVDHVAPRRECHGEVFGRLLAGGRYDGHAGV